MTESEILYWLSISGLTVRRQAQIILRAGGIKQIEQSFCKDEEFKKLCSDKYPIMKRALSSDFIKENLRKLKNDEINVATQLNPLYPERLKQSEVCAPFAFYYKGNLELLNTDCIAVVGTRSVSSYGKRMTEKFTQTLVENGFTIVSGLATGVDGISHEVALDNHGKTIAVLGSGHNYVNPVSHAELYKRILDNDGLIISEYKPDVTATKYTFPERNRIISGISKGVLVVEAGEKSGALITANFALEQGRDVFAIPGNLDSSRSVGTNNLIYSGANLVRSGEDICAHYGITIDKKKNKNTNELDDNEKTVYELLKDETSFDDLVEQTGIMPQDLSVILVKLEMDGYIKRTSMDNYLITEN
ncbi:MAG: DNA-protecting protein DprA [Clostridiales bacterium]|nr:DNA-protecting protein DprA [Clostridiales bacterium]